MDHRSALHSEHTCTHQLLQESPALVHLLQSGNDQTAVWALGHVAEGWHQQSSDGMHAMLVRMHVFEIS